ncbi:matrixin family metalloprotease [Aestuariimicrobium sp. T2.26MG-19.2B]|uniref:matrixin family metalloprotease n=1 Tax=Aestuariimicrobium sp. T2.26MG-19.2B TaxID=3040679 RepID=UPI0024778DCE|nr:matrixin family metalloprotease [Aestuariimicrobium sp. T2.26MG-19.2B]CAI9411778.1 hypothetical protein AESSP_02718 [Aestuariimicrobium sp. T2.26MG-19.2B]
MKSRIARTAIAAAVTSLVLVGLGSTPASADVCETPAVLTPAQLNDAATASCPLSGKQVRLSVLSDFFVVDVPAPGDMAVMFAESLDDHGTSYAISTSTDGHVAALVAGRLIGHPAAAPRVQLVGSAHAHDLSPASEDTVLSGCGSSSSYAWKYALNGGLGVWPSAGYNWWHNTSGQPASNAYSLLDASFANAIADSSSCGTGATSTPKFSRLGNTTRDAKTHDGYSVIGYEDLSGTLLGLAGYWVSGNNIVEADIRIDNATSWHMSTSLPVPAGRVDFMSLAVHEILHNWGLDHVADTDQIMYASFNTGAGSDRRTKRSGDLNGFNILYT